MMRALVPLLMCLALLSSAASAASSGAAADSDPDVQHAITLAQEGEFEQAIKALETLVVRYAGKPAKRVDLARVHVYRSVAYVGLGKNEEAAEAFRQALGTDPNVVVDEKEFPPKFVRFFEKIRAEFAPVKPATAEEPATRPAPTVVPAQPPASKPAPKPAPATKPAPTTAPTQPPPAKPAPSAPGTQLPATPTAQPPVAAPAQLPSAPSAPSPAAAGPADPAALRARLSQVVPGTVIRVRTRDGRAMALPFRSVDDRVLLLQGDQGSGVVLPLVTVADVDVPQARTERPQEERPRRERPQVPAQQTQGRELTRLEALVAPFPPGTPIRVQLKVHDAATGFDRAENVIGTLRNVAGDTLTLAAGFEKDRSLPASAIQAVEALTDVAVSARPETPIRVVGPGTCNEKGIAETQRGFSVNATMVIKKTLRRVVARVPGYVQPLTFPTPGAVFDGRLVGSDAETVTVVVVDEQMPLVLLRCAASVAVLDPNGLSRPADMGRLVVER